MEGTRDIFHRKWTGSLIGQSVQFLITNPEVKKFNSMERYNIKVRSAAARSAQLV